jgi:dipeptidyl aminopeptidase/acylaminoacyl peptidase
VLAIVAGIASAGASSSETLEAIAARLPAAVPETLRDARGLRLSPDGKSFAWVENGALCLADSNGDARTRHSIPALHLDTAGGPTWSSDSKSVALTYYDWKWPKYSSVLVIARPADAQPTEVHRYEDGDLYRPSWSPDAKSLAFVAIRREQGGTMGEHTRAELRIVQVADRSVRSIALSGEGWNKAAVAWRPDGSAIAVALGGPLRHSALLVSPADSSIRVLDAQYFADPRRLLWSRDGEKLALVTLTHVFVASAPKFELKANQLGTHQIDAAWIDSTHVLCMLVSHRDRDLKDALDDFALHGGEDRYRFVPTLVECEGGKTLVLEERSFHVRHIWAWPESQPRVSVLFAHSRD